jgi:nitrogen fixation/metabolism regulation signal transduction histidine kinase
MLHNLIRNAGQASEEQILITIQSQVRQQQGQAELNIEIRDNGPGFPEMVLEQPFQPYVTHKQDGSGLGLAICRKIVSEHDGRMAISNLSTGGARVQITIPLNQLSEAAGKRQAAG